MDDTPADPGLLARIERSAPPPPVEYETVWHGGEGLSSYQQRHQR